MVSQTDAFEKMRTNIETIQYVIQRQLPVSLEKMILNRLYEFDSITRLFDRKAFLQSNEKEKYYTVFEEVLSTTEALHYDFTENFLEPWHQVLVALFKEKI